MTPPCRVCRAALPALENALAAMKQLPCRADEMTGREMAIYEIAAGLCGAVTWAVRILKGEG